MRILIIRNNIVDGTTFIQGMEMLKGLLASINFPTEFTIVESTRVFNSVPFIGANPEVSGGYHVNPAEILQEEKNYGEYDVVCLIFDPLKVNGNKPTNPTDSQDVFQIPSDWFKNAPEVLAQYFLHELCHEMFWKYSRPDITHSFYTSQFSQKPNGLIEYYLYLLKQFPVVEKKADVQITRFKDTGKETLGNLIAHKNEDTFKCVTIELSWKDNKKMISCIPKGIYQVKKVFWPRKLKSYYQVQNVPGRSGIFIHEGNFFFNYEGCIGCGTGFAHVNNDGEIDITNTRNTIKNFETFMKNEPFTLTIV